MTGSIIFLVIACLAGMAMAVQGSLNSVLGKFVGLWESTFIVHVIGTIIVFLLLFVGRLGHGNFHNAFQAPWYTYLGGLLNVLIIFGVVISIPKVGVGAATTAIIVGQVLTAVLIDHFGLFGLHKYACSWWDLIGIAFLAIGAKLLLH